MSDPLQTGIKYIKKNDKILKGIICCHENCNLKPSKNYFKDLVRSIISQQLSAKASSTIFKRFSKLLNYKINPKTILKLNPVDFRIAGISIQKSKYLLHLSDIYLSDQRIFKRLYKLSNEEIIIELIKIKGIGLWTAQMFLIFSMNRLDVLPLDDIGIRNSVKLHYNLKYPPNQKKIIEISKNWGNYSSIAVWYLWKGLDNKKITFSKNI